MDNNYPSRLTTIMAVWMDSQLFTQVMKSINCLEGDGTNLLVARKRHV